MTQLMDGYEIDYTYDGGWRFVVRFENGLASYKFMGDSGDVSAENTDIPYQAREIRDGLVHTIWHETDIDDLITLVIDLRAKTISSGAIIGYREDTRATHFENGVITSIKRV